MHLASPQPAAVGAVSPPVCHLAAGFGLAMHGHDPFNPIRKQTASLVILRALRTFVLISFAFRQSCRSSKLAKWCHAILVYIDGSSC
jgi:hypothetical protein